VNSPLFTKRPSREEILTENLFDLPSPPVGCRPLSITLHLRAQYTSDSPCRVKQTAPSTIPHWVVNVAGEASVVREKLVDFLDG
jgi:hypothetical protein